MLFADASLVRRIESAELRLLVDLAEAGRARNPGADVLIMRCGQAAAIHAGRVSPLNKVFGLGLEPVDEGALAAIEEQLWRRRTPVRVEISTLADGAITAMLTRRGYALVGFENVLGLELDAARAGCDLAVVTTEPGSKSQENVQRQGFSLLYARAVLVRPPAEG